MTELSSATACASRIFDLIDVKEEVDDGKKKFEGEIQGNIDIEKVDFSYTSDKKLIQNFNLSVEKGKKIAIVGPTGCGKTTLINLLMRFYDLTDSTIYLGNTDITKIKRSSLRNQYGMVLQESWMFNTSIKDNIAYGNFDASEEEIYEACKKANIRPITLHQFRHSHATLLKDNGVNVVEVSKRLGHSNVSTTLDIYTHTDLIQEKRDSL